MHREAADLGLDLVEIHVTVVQEGVALAAVAVQGLEEPVITEEMAVPPVLTLTEQMGCNREVAGAVHTMVTVVLAAMGNVLFIHGDLNVLRKS
jgi:hypothetical protein